MNLHKSNEGEDRETKRAPGLSTPNSNLGVYIKTSVLKWISAPFPFNMKNWKSNQKNVTRRRKHLYLYCYEHHNIVHNLFAPLASLESFYLSCSQNPHHWSLQWIYQRPTYSHFQWKCYSSRGNGFVWYWKPIQEILKGKLDLQSIGS